MPFLGQRSETDAPDAATASGTLSKEFEKLFPRSSPAAQAFLKQLRDLEQYQDAYRALFHAAQHTTRIAGQLDLDRLAEYILDQGLRLVGAERGLLVLCGNDGEYQVTASRHLNLDTEHSIEISRSLVSQVIESGKPLITTDVQNDPRLSMQESVLALSIRSVLAVPLTTQDEIIGAFYLDTRVSTQVFDDADLRVIEAFSGITASAIGLIQAVAARDALHLQSVRALANTVEAKDPYTAGHSNRVGIYAQAIMKVLGCDDREVENALTAGYLHDIGKIGVSDAYVTKPGKLEAHEWEEFKQHTVIGERILKNLQSLKEILPAVRWHHERFDGAGYPDGLSGESIPFLARVVCVADAFDAMTTDRPYRPALSRAEAVTELYEGAGTQFDPRVVKAMIQVLNARLVDADI